MTILALTIEELERWAYAEGDIYTAELLRTHPINDNSPDYQAGYEAGYDAGTRDAKDADEGYDAGYKVGLADGREEQEEKT